MALQHFSKVFGVKDAKISKVTADPSGGTTTYATSLDIPGVRAVSAAGTMTVKDLRGDNTFLDSDAVLDSLTITLDYAKLSTDVLAILMGGSVVDSGTTPNQVSTYSLPQNPTFNSFKIEAQAASTDFATGDIHYVFWKCRLVSFPQMGLADEDYQMASVQVRCFPRLSDNKWLDIVSNETAAPIT